MISSIGSATSIPYNFSAAAASAPAVNAVRPVVRAPADETRDDDGLSLPSVSSATASAATSAGAVQFSGDALALLQQFSDTPQNGTSGASAYRAANAYSNASLPVTSVEA